ncbi:MAG TPA: dTDP-4-dehydrorhamnose reductase [Acidobacteriota bacterium]|nr:dTDP-4-dehydrorhamnose reductase [Acidobacteriota bacterium]
MATAGKLLVTGSKGQLGRDLVRLLSPAGEVIGVDLGDVDVCDRGGIISLVESVRPDVVLHAAACTDVDACETNRDLAFAVNQEGTRNVALACRETGAELVYYSTDYVFDGEKGSPYTEDDTPNPLNVYGRSKLAGEEAVRETLDRFAILRVAWMYGRYGKNFVKTMLELGGRQRTTAERGGEPEPLRVVDDQMGNPTWTEEVVRQTREVVRHRLTGIFHATAEGEVSWYQLAVDVFSLLRQPVQVIPSTTAEYPRPAVRPKRSSLENARLKAAGLNVMRHYRIALEEFVGRYGRELWS